MLTVSDSDDLIIKSVTKEILDEINGSEKVLNTEEIREKVNKRLNEIFSSNGQKIDEAKVKKEDEIENKIEEDFKVFEEDDDLSSLLDMKEKDEANNYEASDGVSNVDNLQAVCASKNQEFPEEKKKFFQEISDLYKDELSNSINCFKNVIDSLKIMKDSSFIEILLILLILAIPAFLGGIITLVIIAIILLLWQLHIFLNVFIKWFKKAEDSIKGTIDKIRKKIADMKTSGGWFNRLLFSNALYSVILFNGMFYMLIKGLMLPLKSMDAIDKMLANFISKSVRVVTTTLKGPSELALNNFRTDALVSSKVAGKAQTQKPRSRLKMPERPVERGKQQERRRDMHQKVEAVKQAVATENKQAQKQLVEGVQRGQGLPVQEQFKQLAATHGVDAAVSTPNSAKLSEAAQRLSRRDELGGSIMESINGSLIGAMLRGGIEGMKLADSLIPQPAILQQPKIDPRIAQDIVQERAEKQGEIVNSTSSLARLGITPEQTEQILNKYDNGIPFEESLKTSTPNWDKLDFREQVQAAVEFGSVRTARDDLGDIQQFQHWEHENQGATYGQFLDYKVAEAQLDMKNEKEEFSSRYGANCDELIKGQMIKDGYDPDRVLSDKEFLDVAARAVENFPPDMRLSAAKDLSEYHDSWVEMQRCEQEAAAEKVRASERSQESSFGAAERMRQQEHTGSSTGIGLSG